MIATIARQRDSSVLHDSLSIINGVSLRNCCKAETKANGLIFRYERCLCGAGEITRSFKFTTGPNRLDIPCYRFLTACYF